jgi:hypothetical protein
MIRILGLSLGGASLLGLGIWGSSSATAADGEQPSTATPSVLATSAKSAPPVIPADAPPPAVSGEAISGAALEHRLDELERDIQGPAP